MTEPSMPLEEKQKGDAKNSFLCSVCKINCTSYDLLQQHIVGKKHRKRLHLEATKQQNPEHKVSPDSSLITVAVTEEGMENNENKANIPTSGELEKEDVKISPENELIDAPMVDGEEKKGDAEIVSLVADTKKRPSTGDQDQAAKKTRQGNGSNVGKEKKPVILERCELCNVTCTSKVMLESHLNGKKHAARLKRLSTEPPADSKVVNKTEDVLNEVAKVEGDEQGPAACDATTDTVNDIADSKADSNLNDTLAAEENTISSVE